MLSADNTGTKLKKGMVIAMISITYRGCMLYLSVSSVIVTMVAIVLDFTLFGDKSGVKCFRKSIVATGTMFGFFAVYFLAMLLTPHPFDNDLLIFAGTACVVAGACINIAGRLSLKGNWANHIKIYDSHRLVNTGVFRWVRHPLYASIMLMLLGGSVMFKNVASAILTLCIFIPFMYYRARQEERMLCESVEGYAYYLNRTGMFFPRLRPTKKKKA